jgi:hypothetical protein
METMEEMTGVREARDPLTIRAKPGPKGKGPSAGETANEGKAKSRGKGKKKVEIAVWDEDAENGAQAARSAQAMPPPAAPRMQRARRSGAFTGSYAIQGEDDFGVQQEAGPSSEVPNEEELDYMDES